MYVFDSSLIMRMMHFQPQRIAARVTGNFSLLILTCFHMSILSVYCLPATFSPASSELTSHTDGVSENVSSADDFLTVSLDNASPDPAYFGPQSWVSYNMFTKNFILESPWDPAKIMFTESPSTYSESHHLLIYNKETLENSMDVSAKMSGEISGFSTSGLADYARNTQTSSTSTSVSVMMKTNIKSLTLPLSGSELIPMLKADAVKLAKGNPETFFKKYGTHFISLQQYACYAELNGRYMFESVEMNSNFTAKLEAKYKGGVFNAGASSSIGLTSKAVSNKSSFEAWLKGDTFEIAPTDPSSLESWSNSLVANFSRKCIEHSNSTQVRQIQVRSWTTLFGELPGAANLDSGMVAVLQKASLLRQIAYEGYQSMASYFDNHRFAQEGQKQWTEGLGHICEWSRDGPYTITGPQGKAPNDMLSMAQKLNQQGWAPTNGSAHDINPSSAVMNYFQKMAIEYANYVQIANQYIPSVHVEFRGMKPWSTEIGHSVNERYVLDVFNKPTAVVDGYVNVCLKQFARDQAIVDGCVPNVTSNGDIPVQGEVVLAPLISIPVSNNPGAFTSIKVTKPKSEEEQGFAYNPVVIECSLIDRQLDDEDKYTINCDAGAVWCTEGYSGGLCAANEYRYPNMYVVYGIFGDTDGDYKEYRYPGCSKRLF